MSITVAFSTVLIMLLYAVPGFAMIKTKLVTKDSIPAVAKLLMYVCQPALVVASMSKVTFSDSMTLELLTVFAIMLLSQGIAIGIMFLVLKKTELISFMLKT